MDAETQNAFCRFLIRELRSTIHELNAYRVMAYGAGKFGFPVERILNEARNSVDVRKRSDRAVAGLEELLDNTAQETLDRAVQEFLKNPAFPKDVN